MEATILFPTVAPMPSAPYNNRKMSSGLTFFRLLQATHISFVYVSCLSNCLQWLPSRRWWQQRPSPPPRSQISPPMLPPSRRSPSRSPPPPPPPCFLCLYRSADFGHPAVTFEQLTLAQLTVLTKLTVAPLIPTLDLGQLAFQGVDDSALGTVHSSTTSHSS